MRNDTTYDTDVLDFMQERGQPVVDDRPKEIADLEKHYAEINKLAHTVRFLEVADKESSGKALNIIADVRAVVSTIEEYRKKAIAPSRLIINTINECATNLRLALGSIESEVKGKLEVFDLQERRRMEQARVAVEELSESLGIEIGILTPKESMKLASAKAATYYREKVSFEIEDATLIPKEYWKVDEYAIQKDIDLGKRDIPGIKLTKEKNLVIRRK